MFYHLTISANMRLSTIQLTNYSILNKIRPKFWLQYLLFKTIQINKLQVLIGKYNMF